MSQSHVECLSQGTERHKPSINVICYYWYCSLPSLIILITIPVFCKLIIDLLPFSFPSHFESQSLDVQNLKHQKVHKTPSSPL